MGSQYQAANIKAPYDVDSNNEASVKKFTAGTTHAANSLPTSWAGKYVSIYVSGGDLHYFFSKSSSAEVDSGVTATAEGASTKVGDFIKDGNKEHVRLPSVLPSDTLYFVREASASCTVYMRLASD